MSDDWKRIDEKHGPLVWQAVYRILQSHAESLDCYQDVMLEAYEQSKTQAIRNWPGYLRWLAVRRGIDRLRSKQRGRDRIEFVQDIEHVAIPESSHSSGLEMEELQDRIKTELASLPETQAEAFWLRFIELMSYSEIAEQMNIESQSVGVLIHRARTRMRQAIADLRQSFGERNEQSANQ